MEGNVVTAAKWLGASMVLASLILVVGLRWVVVSAGSDRPAGAPSVQAGPVGPPPGDLEELAKSFHGARPEPASASVGRPRSLFADEPSEAGPPPVEDREAP